METSFWLGSQANLTEYQERQHRLDTAMASGMYAEMASAEPEGFSLHGNIAVIDIKGPLVSSESFMNDFFGMTSYTRIRNHLVEAATHPDVGAIVLNIDSGGGTPNGLPDVSNLIRNISPLKPVTAFTGGTMASAAYWLGSAADKVFAGPTSSVGSIGVIATLMDRTEQFKQEGIEPVVLRAGSKKALANPYEPVTKEVKAQVQDQLDRLYGVFVDYVAEHRGVTSSQVLKSMADGQEFIGEQAVQAGLVDGITTLDALVGSLQTRIESKKPSKETTMAKKQLLTEQQVALIAEGVDLQTALEGNPTETSAPAVAVAEPATPETPPVEVQASAPAAESGELVTFLRSELTAKTVENTQLSLKIADIERELGNFKSTHDGLKAIVATRINNMQIGLGGKALFSADLPAEVLLAQHAQIEPVFSKQYPIGGVSKPADPEPAQSLNADPMTQARLRAVQTHK